MIDLRTLGERTLWIDCDVLQADGGTRTASITGAFVALVEALRKLQSQRSFPEIPVLDFVAATSVGRVDGQVLLDLNYEEDSRAEVDMNIVRTGAGRFVEIQGTAESGSFSGEELAALMAAAEKGTRELVEAQRKVIGDLPAFTPKPAKPRTS